jgi:predicted HAD superfamily Cof-like phosphohydrolase
MSSYYTDVVAWHLVFGVPVADRPQPVPADRLQLRLDLMAEEHRELVEALEADDVANSAKEAADLIVTVLGTMAEMGVPFDAVWAAVHASNMAKRGPDKQVIRRADGKILKPEGWQPPDIRALLFAAATSGSAA